MRLFSDQTRGAGRDCLKKKSVYVGGLSAPIPSLEVSITPTYQQTLLFSDYFLWLNHERHIQRTEFMKLSPPFGTNSVQYIRTENFPTRLSC
jgi:hypothetical protein